MNLHRYHAARERAVFFAEPDRGRIAATGADRAAYFHGLLTNDIQALTPGTGCYAAYLTAQGRMISDVYVLELGDAILIDVPQSTHADVLARFDQFVFSEDVQLADATDVYGQLSVVGPAAAEAIASLWSAGACGPAAEELSTFAAHQNRRLAIDDVGLIVARGDRYGVPCFTVYVQTTGYQALMSRLEAAGVPHAEGDVAETLRIEAGVPLFGLDMDSDTIPLEAGIEDRAISFTKGCYVGQEVIARVLHRGHGRVAKKLVGLRVSGPVPARGDAIRHGDTAAGRVTSAANSPLLDSAIALGYVHRNFTAPGTELVIDRAGEPLAAQIVNVPFTPSSRAM